jgi:hypothetical protein
MPGRFRQVSNHMVSKEIWGMKSVFLQRQQNVKNHLQANTMHIGGGSFVLANDASASRMDSICACSCNRYSLGVWPGQDARHEAGNGFALHTELHPENGRVTMIAVGTGSYSYMNSTVSLKKINGIFVYVAKYMVL